MLTAIVGQDESSRKAHRSQTIAIDFEELGICLDLFVIRWARLQSRASGCAEYHSDQICDKHSLI
jgi:hypothetical protein